MKITSTSLVETKKIARDFFSRLKKSNQVKVVCLKGGLGSGKTTLVKFGAESLGIKKNILSPTFVILKRYRLAVLGFRNLIHIDAYRLKREKELENLGWSAIIKNPENLIFIEWPENVPRLIPKEAVIIKFKVLGESRRLIEIRWPLKKKTPKNQG